MTIVTTRIHESICMDASNSVSTHAALDAWQPLIGWTTSPLIKVKGPGSPLVIGVVSAQRNLHSPPPPEIECADPENYDTTVVRIEMDA